MQLILRRLILVLAATLVVLFGTLNAALAWTLSGTVYGGSNPLPNATVTLSNATTQAQQGSATTDANGRFSFNADNGSYNLQISPAADTGLTTSTVSNIVISGADVTQNVILIRQAVSLSGVIRTPAGTGIRNLSVYVREQASGITAASATTDDNGGYSVPLAAGTYQITIGQAGTSNVPLPMSFAGYSIIQNLAVTGNMTRDITIPLVTLSGKTTDGNGVPVGNVTVNQTWNSVSYGDGYFGLSNYVTSDASGNYSMTVMAGTGFSVILAPPASSGLAQTVVTGIDVPVSTVRNFALLPAITLSGVVRTPGGTGITNLSVYVREQATGITAATATTDENGRYSAPLAAGTYQITIGQAGTSNVPLPMSFAGYSIIQNLAVTENMTRDITIPLVTLSGKTTDGNGVPVGNVTVNQTWNSVSYGDGYFGLSNYVTSDASGNYSMTLMAGAGFSVILAPPASSGLAQTVVTGIDAPVSTVRDFALLPAITLSGVVRTPGGTGITNLSLYVREQATGITAATATTDENGRYSAPLAAGTYQITIGQAGTSNVPLPMSFAGYSIIQNIAVTENMTRDITMPLVTLSGKTTDGNGVPVGNVTVNQTWNSVSYGDGYFGLSNYVTSDASGAYSMTLIAGTGYSQIIMPPPGSGFAQTVVNGIEVNKNILQNIILSMPDSKAPAIISGPTLASNTDTTATIEWLTDEPAKGSIVYGTANPPVTSVAETAEKPAASHAQQLKGLAPNTVYYVKVTASDAAGNGPTTSSIISFRTNPAPDTTPPVILTGPSVNTITQVSAVVEWSTDEPTVGVLAYGLSGTPDQSVSDATLATSHRVTLAGLNPETTYYVRVTATDAAGNSTVSNPVVSFPTQAAPDTKAPVIVEGPMVINVSDTGATITWTTDEKSTSGVSWNDGTRYGVLSDDNLVTSHTMTVTGLSASTSYSFTVSSKDAFGNGPTLSREKSFTTQAAPDTQGPVFIQTPIVKNTTHQSAVLYWETDETASGLIVYGTSPSFGQTEARAALKTKHNRPLTGLLPGTTYYFYVVATDAAKNSSTSQTYSFTTEVIPDTKPPVITEAASIVYSSDTQATVAFATDKPCDTVVNYGPNGGTGSQKTDPEKVTRHQMTLTNLTPNTSYNVQVSCTDISGNTVVASAGTPSTFLALNEVGSLSDVVGGAAPGIGFTTPSLPDTTAPVIGSAPQATAITAGMVRIVWSTDEIADSQVYFGLSGQPLTRFAGDMVQVTGHSVALTNLAAGTAYQFRVQTTDPSNNTAVSAVYGFTTAALADTSAPLLSGVVAEGVSSSQLHVSWTSNEPATTVLRYGATPFALTGQVSLAGLGTGHSVTLYNLTPGTTYYVAPVSADGSGNSVQGETQSVTLAGQAPVSYTVAAAVSGGGSVTPTSQSVVSGYQLALAVTPNQGYLLGSITGCGGTLVGSVYTTAAVTGNCTVSASFNPDPNVVGVLTTTAYPAGGNYTGGTVMVQLKATSESAAIYYTTDGSAPTTTSTLYAGPIPVAGTKTIKFFAKDGSTVESAKSATYSSAAAGQPGASYSGLKRGTSFTVYRSEAGKAPVSVYSGSQTSFSDTAALKPNTVYSYTVASDQEGATGLLTIRTPLYNGWNIVAVPYNTTGVAVSSLFAGSASSVYQWNPTGTSTESSTTQHGSYSSVSTLAPGLGYFVKALNGSTLLAYAGAAGPVSATVTLKPGWTMIANPNTTTRTNIGTGWLIDGNPLSGAVSGNKIGGSVYYWNGTAYDSWTILGDNPQIEPWKGYWIINLDTVNHTLTIQ